MKASDLSTFLINIDHLSNGEKASLVKNHAPYKDGASFDVIMTIMKCIPDGVPVVNDKEWQNLLFTACVRCELGHNTSVQPRNAVASVLATNKSGQNQFSDLLSQSVESLGVYPLMRRYLSRCKRPINTVSLFYDLQSWDDLVNPQKGDSHTMPTRHEWAAAFTRAKKAR